MLAGRAQVTIFRCAPASVLFLCLGALKGADGQPPACRNEAEVQRELQLAANPAKPFQERVEAYKHAITTCPEDPSLYSDLAEQLFLGYQFDEGLSWIQKGLKLRPDDPKLNLDYAGALLLLRRPAQVVSILKPLPPSAKGMYLMGLAYRNLESHRASQQALSKAWDLGYHDPFLLYVLIEQCRFLGDNQQFSEALQKLQKAFPDSPWSHMAQGDAQKARQDRTGAEKEYKLAQKLDPNLPFLNHRLGSTAYMRGDYASATEYFRKEIALNPTFPAPYVFLGVCLHREGKDVEALPYLQKGLAYAPDAPLAYLNLAIVQIELKQFDEAVETLEAGEKKFPDVSFFPGKLAGLLRRMGRSEEAKVQAALAQELGQKQVRKQEDLIFGELEER
jgi:tetratricopeptide (TPR) repeat protein